MKNWTKKFVNSKIAVTFAALNRFIIINHLF